MHKRLTILAAGAWLGMAGGAQAADGLRLSGSVRVRYETVDGQVRTGFNGSDNLVSLRTIVNGEYRRGAWRVGGEFDDSRAWGGNVRTPVTNNEVNAFEPVAAYLGWDGRVGALGPVSVQAGRFLLNLGSRRLMAADDYRNTVNSNQGLRIDLAPAGVKTTLIYVQPVIRLPDGAPALLANRQRPDRASPEVELWGGVADKAGGPLGGVFEATYLHLQERDGPGRPTRDRALDTYGARLFLDPKAGHWDYDAEGLLQTGSISKGLGAADPRLPVQAAMVHVGGGYSWAGGWTPHLSGLFDVVTGDHGGNRYGRFDTLYGMRRGDFAPSGIYAATGRANMISPGVRLEVTPKGAPWDGFVTVREMWAESRTDAFSNTGVRDASGRSGAYAGTQVEGRARRWLIKDRLRAELDFALLAKGELLTEAPNAPHSGPVEHYLSLNLQAQF